MKDFAVNRRTMLAGSGAAVLATSTSAFAAAGAAPTVRVRDGQLRGFALNGASSFLGIPYGAPTGGAARFLPPRRPAPWSGVRDATRLGERSPQTDAPVYATPVSGDYMSGGRRNALLAYKEPMGEDCLNLNVLTPVIGKGSRPVMVYLHGGGFSSGSGALDAD